MSKSEDHSKLWARVIDLMRRDIRELGREPEHVGRFLRRCYGANENLQAQFRRSWGFNANEMHAIYALWEGGRLPMSEVGRRIPLSRAAVTTMTDRLEAIGYVRRVPDPTDRRRIFLEITEKFEIEGERVFGPWGERVAKYAEQLGPEKWGIVVDAFADLRDLARDEAASLRLKPDNVLRARATGEQGVQAEDPAVALEPTWW